MHFKELLKLLCSLFELQIALTRWQGVYIRGWSKKCVDEIQDFVRVSDVLAWGLKNVTLASMSLAQIWGFNIDNKEPRL